MTLRTASANHNYSGRHCEKGVCYTGVVNTREYEGSAGEKERIVNAFRRGRGRGGLWVFVY